MKFFVRLASLFCFLAMSGTAFAEGFALYEYGARGIALGGAVMARGNPDPSTLAYNPALMTRLDGARVQAGITAIMPRGKMEWTEQNGNNGTTHLRDNNWFMPHFYYTQQLSEDWFLGVGEFTRFGLGFEYPSSWPGRFNIYEVSLLTASINPNIAWRATDKLSLAAGVEVMYVTLDLRKRGELSPRLPAGNREFDINIKGADAFGVGGNFALHYQFNEQWAIGAQYRSKIRVHAFGDASFNNISVPDTAYPDILKNDGTAHAAVVFPDSLAGGLSFTPIPELSFEVGAVWTRWSTFRSLNISFDNALLGQQPSWKHWKDTMRYNFGVEWAALDWLTLRGGFVYDESPMTEGWEDYLVPTNDRYIWSAGLGFHWDNWTVDLSAAFIDAIGRRYAENPDTHVLRSRAKASDTYIYSLSVGYKF
ncbi:outer membrane protein transport protein [Desulfovibrio sp. OttesenSCG-928-G11]|nr:outer membrane protein transport protein [Desulfovibrio sp. OttesenSCG-928-G11]